MRIVPHGAVFVAFLIAGLALPALPLHVQASPARAAASARPPWIPSKDLTDLLIDAVLFAHRIPEQGARSGVGFASNGQGTEKPWLSERRAT
jgi:hypothetical protein